MFIGFILEVTAIGENEIVPNTRERLLELNNHVYVFIALIGWFKTKEEIFTTVSLSQQNRLKPISLLNVKDFYSLLLFFLNGAMLQDFLPILARRVFVHVNIANELIDML